VSAAAAAAGLQALRPGRRRRYAAPAAAAGAIYNYRRSPNASWIPCHAFNFHSESTRGGLLQYA